MAVRQSLGAIPCLCCGQQVPVKKTATSVTVSCPWCDLSAYAKDGTEAHRRIMAALPKAPATEQPASPAPVPETKEAARFKPSFA